MIIAVASGKGGTGKTTVAVSLALALAGDRRPLVVDCDVEEPNAGLFLNYTAKEKRDVVQPVPEVDEIECESCGRCAEVCAFNAISMIGGKVLVFPELCHGCGSCATNCPSEAIREVDSVLGTLERGPAGKIDVAVGRVEVGVVMPGPAIRQLKRWVLPPGSNGGGPIIIDSPPGTSCPVVETIRGSDFVLLVTEPTPFGEHDLRIAVEVARDELGLPVGVVLNRVGGSYTGIEDFCDETGVSILMRIPHDRRIAEAYSDGVPLVDALPEYRTEFQKLFTRISSAVTEQER
jgi:MinD superfamily P-loop ATPase